MLNYLKPLLFNVLKPDWTIYKDVAYGTDEQQKADLYILNNNKRNKPTVIFIHGGGWQAGDNDVYAGRAKKWALAGFNVVALNYRLGSGENNHWPTQLADVKQAYEWLLKDALFMGIDSDRIVVGGDSAGAHLALFFNQKGVRSIIDISGPTDLTQPDMNANVCNLDTFGRKTYEQDPYLYRNASPVFSLTKNTPSVFIAHGTEDEVVPYSQALILKSKLDNLGVSCKMITFNGGHEIGKLPWYKELYIEFSALWFAMRNI